MRALPLATLLGALWIAAGIIQTSVAPVVAETRWYRDLTRQTPFHSVEGQAFTTEDGRQCVAVVITKRRCTIVRPPEPPLIGRGVGADGKEHRLTGITLLNRDGVSGRDLPPGRTEIGPFCVEARNPPLRRVTLYTRHTCPGEAEVQTNELVTVEWPDLPSPD